MGAEVQLPGASKTNWSMGYNTTDGRTRTAIRSEKGGRAWPPEKARQT